MLLFLLGLQTALFLEIGDAGRDVNVGVGGGVDFFEKGLELVFFEGLDEVEEVLDRGAGTGACQGRHCVCCFFYFFLRIGGVGVKIIL